MDRFLKALSLREQAFDKIARRISAEGLPTDLVDQIRKVGWKINREISRKIDAEIVQKSILKIGDVFPHFEDQKNGLFRILADTDLNVHNDWCEYTVRDGRVTAVFTQEVGQEWSLQSGIRQKIADYLKVEVTSTFHIAFDESIYQGWVDPE